MKLYRGYAGGKSTTERQAYDNAVARCRNPKHPYYKDYGGRGITFDFESYQQFMAEVGRKPTPEHSLDRIKNDEGYKPGNVRWATHVEQRANSRPHPSGYFRQGPPVITIMVRHSKGCKYSGDEFCKRCNCRKALRWSRGGEQFRKSAGTRSWAEAEKAKDRLEAELTGAPLPASLTVKMSVADAVDIFMAAKRNDGLEPPTLQKLAKVTSRILNFCNAEGVYALESVNLTHVSTWPWSRYFKTTHSLTINQQRVKSFFRYFHNAGVLTHNPAASWKAVKGKTTQVSGFEPEEFEHILKTAEARIRALILVMRYAGLAIIDAATLERSNIREQNGNYRIYLSSRQKTSKRHTLQAIDNAIPVKVAKELLTVLNGNPRYVFWHGGKSGEGTDQEKREAVKHWQKKMRALLDEAGFPKATSHKFRHTLAIEMIRAGASFEDVAAALGNTVGVVAKFYSHEWAKVRQHRTDKAIRATWTK